MNNEGRRIGAFCDRLAPLLLHLGPLPNSWLEATADAHVPLSGS